MKTLELIQYVMILRNRGVGAFVHIRNKMLAYFSDYFAKKTTEFSVSMRADFTSKIYIA